MIEAVYRRHYHPGLTGSFHGDMAYAFLAMLRDGDLGQDDRRRLIRAVMVHIGIEADPRYTGRKWFTELFNREVLRQWSS